MRCVVIHTACLLFIFHSRCLVVPQTRYERGHAALIFAATAARPTEMRQKGDRKDTCKTILILTQRGTNVCVKLLLSTKWGSRHIRGSPRQGLPSLTNFHGKSSSVPTGCPKIAAKDRGLKGSCPTKAILNVAGLCDFLD